MRKYAIYSHPNSMSLDIVEFITSLESEFGIMIPQDSVQDVRTVGQVVEVVEKMVK